jgi:hypothetical protein
MDPMHAWLESSFDLIRAGFAAEADASTRERAATACLSLHAMLSPAQLVPMAPLGEPSQPAEPDIIDSLIQRFEALLPMSTAPAGFRPSIVPTERSE